ncbi:30S ribosomal protein S4e [Candidatus Micrarchaeota archaeon]|nr:30S ribosomal protein S4e [Candidatus Micrarchaeota archaeon]MBU1930742.1 30S ribosomal protein S4e [Candidatus Micrarchaeota archaeon]
MANKGGSNKSKRIALPKARQVLRKKHIWAIKPRPGPHQQKAVLPLGEILREKLGLASNRKEIKAILNAKKIRVDEKIRTDSKFPVGLFDVVRVEEEKKQYRIVFDPKGRLQVIEMDIKEKPVKVCKIVLKKILGKEKVQLTTNDGRTIIEKKSKTKPGDSVLIELPSQKIERVMPFQEGQLGYLTSGTRTGSIAKIKKVTPATMRRASLVELETKGETFQTLAENIIVIGSNTPVIPVEWTKTEQE